MSRRAALLLSLMLLGALTGLAAQQEPTLSATLERGVSATIGADLQLWLEARPQRREGWIAFAERYCGRGSARRQIQAANPGQGRRLLADRSYRVPFDCLTDDYRERFIAALFPEDSAQARAWIHRVERRPAGQRESLWRIAQWFTGSGQNYRALRELNRFADEDVVPGQTVLVPLALLRQPFRQAVEEQARLARASELSYGRDQLGEYAVYSLQPGEALYSSVVVRFTGRLFAEEVNPLAQEIALRSGIDDVTDIPVGYEVKIPLEALSPEFLPPGHARRVEYERGLDASARFSNSVRATDLAGITVILDAGHGGKDIGTSKKGVWESLYVYDIMMRAKQLLEQRTAATVHATTRDGSRFVIENRDVLSYSSGHAVLTTPPYAIETSRVGTTLRWYLANSILARATERGASADKVVFISIHADSLHPSVRGAMVYVPGLLPIPKSYGKSEVVFTSRREVRERPRVSFSKSERVRSEGLSRQLAGKLIAGFRRSDIGIHPNKPVRDRIIRGRGSRPWVPAVLKYNAVPAKVLIEVCNLANEQDLRLLKTRQFRQQVAESIVDGILDYYGAPRERRESVVTAGE